MRTLALSAALVCALPPLSQATPPSEVAATGAATPREESLAEIVRDVRSADYRGAREDLRRLAAALEPRKDGTLVEFRHYWRGFALWRRALNGFNETPTPADLETDLRAAIASFQSALASEPGWIEAQIGVWGCAGPLFFLAKDDDARRQALLRDYMPLVRQVTGRVAGNPRALWLLGQTQAGPGADPAKAAETLHQGLEAALEEARAIRSGEPVWIPRWGGAENLMNLAYLYTYTKLANRELARAYAEGALVAAPEWHYVKDILLPKLLELPSPPIATAAPGLGH